MNDLSHADLAGDLLPACDIAADVPAAAAAPAAEPNGFAVMGLAPELLSAVAELGFTEPTTVQAQAIPMAMPPADDATGFIDLMVSSQTGSGKTAAFLLPVLHTLQARLRASEEQREREWAQRVAEAAERGESAPRRPRRPNPTDPRHFKAAVPGALVLCPTRELAQQVAHDAIDLVRHMRGVRIASVIGGLPYGQQIARLQNASLVVATPGRLLDLQRSGQIRLDEVAFLVVDEADRMLDLGFADDLEQIHQLCASRRQTMMFSATFAPRIQQLAARVMREPRRVQVDTPQDRHRNISQVMFWADNRAHKRKLLDHWLRDPSISQAIVFASTQVECDELANDLAEAGFSAMALHGALSQGLRNRRLMMLRDGRIQILVATDVAARGIDVPAISHVFNYGLPMKAEDYTHRIGRTGRAGRDGLAVTIAEARDQRRIREIESFTRQPMRVEVIPGLEPAQRVRPAFAPTERRGARRPQPGGVPHGRGYGHGHNGHGHGQRHDGGHGFGQAQDHGVGPAVVGQGWKQSAGAAHSRGTGARAPHAGPAAGAPHGRAPHNKPAGRRMAAPKGFGRAR